MYTNKYIYICIYIYIYSYECMYIHIYSNVNIYLYKYTYIYIYIHINVCIFIYIYIFTMLYILYIALYIPLLLGRTFACEKLYLYIYINVANLPVLKQAEMRPYNLLYIHSLKVACNEISKNATMIDTTCMYL